MLKGVEKLADAVAVTMGPTGRNVIIDKSFGGPTVTKDGVTVSKEVELEDRFENMGAKLVNEVASKTSDIAGDGTTTATVLARAIFKEGCRIIAAGSNPMAVRRGIDKAVEAAVEHLKSMAKPVSSKAEIAQVGAISANNDKEIGDLLADAMEKVGKDGVITVEEGKTTETTLKFVEGMQFDKGYISPYFINRPAEMDCFLEDALILIHEKKISNLRELVPMLEKVAQIGQAAVDHRRGRRRRSADGAGRQQAARRAQRLCGEGPGLRRSPQGDAGDIAVLTGGTVISEDLGIKLENLELEPAGPRQEDHGRQERHDDRRRGRQAGRHSKPDPADSQSDRRHRKRIRPREVPGAAGQADRRRGDHLRRRRHRSRHEAEEGPRRRRPARHSGGGRRRHSARRRRGPAPLHATRSRRSAARPRATRKSASTSCCTPFERPMRQIADNCGIDGSVVVDEVSAEADEHRLRRQQPASMSTWSRPASSIR